MILIIIRANTPQIKLIVSNKIIRNKNKIEIFKDKVMEETTKIIKNLIK